MFRADYTIQWARQEYAIPNLREVARTWTFNRDRNSTTITRRENEYQSGRFACRFA